jgi:hypothetical protein
MKRWRAAWIAAAIVATIAFPAPAEEPAHVTYSPAPPGTVAQNQLVYLSGESMHGQWRAVASRKRVGSSGSTAFDQWYLSIYQIDGSTYRLRYQSPRDGGPLEPVKQAAGGAKMWFPLQTLRIAGTAALMQPGVQQLVVQSHESAADCGLSTVTIFATNASGKIVPAASVRNYCDLRATIAHGHGSVPDTIVLSGPYYNKTAPLCCPTKPKGAAVLRYRNGTWTETPNLFPLYPGRLPPP